MSTMRRVPEPRRDGFTFVEMLLVLVLGTILLTGVYGVMLRQEQGYRHMGAMAATQQDTRMGLELLSAEFREISGAGNDLVMATPDSVRFRALRKFGILCDKSSNDKKLTVAQVGIDPFAATDATAGTDSILIYVDNDSLIARDDRWKAEYVQSIGSVSLCGTTLGLQLDLLLPETDLRVLQLSGAGLKFDSVFAGAPIRSFDVLTYGWTEVDGAPMVVRQLGGQPATLFGPIADPGGLVFRYFDDNGTELTSFPLSDADRASVRRVQVELRAERQRGGELGAYTDSLITDIYLRGG